MQDVSPHEKVDERHFLAYFVVITRLRSDTLQSDLWQICGFKMEKLLKLTNRRSVVWVLGKGQCFGNFQRRFITSPIHKKTVTSVSTGGTSLERSIPVCSTCLQRQVDGNANQVGLH